MLPRVEVAAARLAELGRVVDATFRKGFSGPPFKRTGRDRFVRNVLIAIGNSGTPGLAPEAAARLRDPSSLVRAMAVWALGRLLDPGAFSAHRDEHLAGEDDDAVRAEWRAAGSGRGDGGRCAP